MGWYDSSICRLGRLGLQGGHQVGLQGGHQGVLYVVESFQMDSGIGSLGHEWSEVVSADI